MRTIQVRGKTGADGVLHLSIPLGTPGAEVEAVVVVHPDAPTATNNGWPPGFLEEHYGSITDETFFPDSCEPEKQVGS